MSERRIILAADGLKLADCLLLVGVLGSRLHAVKIHDLYDREGPGVIKQIKEAGARRVWVDAKLHDIPETVKNRAAAFADAGADILTVHVSGGPGMMAAARQSFPGELFGITVLTSLKEDQVQEIYGHSAIKVVGQFAAMAYQAALNGVVCSPKEVGILSADRLLKDLKFVIPGTRSAGVDAGDQARVDTPANAIKNGATYLVIGRQLTKALDPVEAIDALEAEIHGAMAEKIVEAT